jgi:hypothetical protein
VRGEEKRRTIKKDGCVGREVEEAGFMYVCAKRVQSMFSMLGMLLEERMGREGH